MNSNMFLMMFGLNPDDFEPGNEEPIECDNGYIIDLIQKVQKNKRICPECGSTKCYVKGRYIANYKDFSPNGKLFYFNVTRLRLKCEVCGKTFSPQLHGLAPYSIYSKNVISKIIDELKTKATFSMVAKRYKVSVAFVIKLFDETYPYVPRGNLPEILCIDEFYFSRESEHKYCCCLVDFKNRELLDIVESRQKEYLDDYFNKISFNERDTVKYFVSDMFEGYERIKNKYFPNSIHIVDLFHVISLLTNTLNSVRLNVLKQRGTNEIYDKFMKTFWDCFLCKFEKIPDKYYSPQTDDGATYHYCDMVTDCVKLDEDFWEGWNVLQDLLHYRWYGTYDESLLFIENISKRLKDTNNELLQKVGQSYHKWRYEIANGFTKNSYHIHISNGIAECINNNIKTIIKLSYGYRNFERFRKRCLIMYLYNK